jgi:hypothetical protein
MISKLVVVAAALAVAAAAPSSASAAPPTCLPATVVTKPGVPVLVNPSCVDVGAAPTITVVKAPTGGTIGVLPGLYTPMPGFRGTDSLQYTVTNNETHETSLWTAVNFVVDSLPGCSDATATTHVGQPLHLIAADFLCHDPDGDPLLIRAEDGAHGVVDPDAGLEVTYTPDPGYVGTDTFAFVASDGAFASGQRTMTITITPAPEATPTPTPTPSASPSPAPPATDTPAVPAPRPDTTKPTVTVKAGRASIAKGVALTLTSSEAGTAKLTLTTGKKTTSKSTKLAGGTTKLTLRLSAKARKALKRKRSVKATLTVVASDAAGNTVTKKLSLTLRS